MSGRRRWGEAPKPPGRPPVDHKIKAKVCALRVEHPGWSLRAIAREAGTSRRNVQRWLAAEGLRGTGAEGLRRAAYVAEAARVGVAGQAVGSGPGREPVPLSTVLPMSAEDHLAFDAYTGPPAGTWFWMVWP